MKNYLLISLFLYSGVYAQNIDNVNILSGKMLQLSYETEADILSDFLSSANIYRYAKPGEILENSLERRKLELSDGRFGKALHIKHGWSVAKGTNNESGIDLDLTVATMWGDWRTKPHYWGAGKFSGDRGTIAFWVKTDALNPGIVFIQGSISWGRKERDLLRIDLNEDGKLSASIRDIYYQYHQIESLEPVWKNNEWQHIAVVYDKAYGLKLYHNNNLIASNWGNDAWWQVPLPGLFSPFLPESHYDEISFYDYPLNADEINSLYSSNSVPQKKEHNQVLDEAARKRLLSCYGDINHMELPTLTVGEGVLSMKQTEIADCHDDKIPAWWVMDGRYELAWPHPYLLFTFILGDADFHGDKLDIDFKEGETANYISLEGVLDGIKVISGEKEKFDIRNQVIDLKNYPNYFYSIKLDMGSNTSLHFPLVSGYGTPPGLVDKGSLNFPLSGKMRLHEVQLWNVTTKKEVPEANIRWQLPFQENITVLDERFLDAFLKLKGAQSRTLFTSSNASGNVDSDVVELSPLQPFHFISPDLNPDMAIDKITLNFSVIPETKSDVLWIKLRDPANPARIWAQTVIRVNFNELNKSQKIEIELDPIDIMLASEDRIWVELMFANKEHLSTGVAPEIKLVLSKDKEKSLSDYAFHEMIPAKMQYMKEYNYQPWLFNGEQRNEKGWSNFGGPYDMWYPPDAVLRHDPDNEIAGIYSRITGERGYTYGVTFEPTFNQYEEVSMSKNIPSNAPSWAVWEREMYKKQLQTIHWITSMQREDGFFWGGCNDDTFIPLGYAGIPLMGDEISKDSFLKLYDGLEQIGIYKDGYCDIWPIDYLHVTDFITSRGLLFPYALGDPYVFERELITAKVYKDIMENNNAKRAKNDLPPYDLSSEFARKDPKLWGEQTVLDYELTQVHWYWGKTPEPKPHHNIDRNEIAREMMNIAIKYDKTEAYNWTKSMRHTDRQG
ncbi:MAG: LamG domain-containing protein, partial [Cyclobacteriaceae bacterium]|nr:LamG domain-containing protein [Cyclobacteriaceae bacterium]